MMQQGMAPRKPTQLPRELTVGDISSASRGGHRDLRTHRTVPAMHLSIIVLQGLRIGRLQVLASWWLHLDDTTILRPETHNVRVRIRVLAAFEVGFARRVHCGGF